MKITKHACPDCKQPMRRDQKICHSPACIKSRAVRELAGDVLSKTLYHLIVHSNLFGKKKDV